MFGYSLYVLSYISGGSIRDGDVIDAVCHDKMVMDLSGRRNFLHRRDLHKVLGVCLCGWIV